MESFWRETEELENERRLAEGRAGVVLSGSGGDWSVSLFVAEEMEVAAMFSRCFLSLSLGSVCECASKVVGEGETLGEKESWRASKDAGRDLCGK